MKMKKIFILAFFIAISQFSNAHNLNEGQAILRHWTTSNTSIEGSFLMCKNQDVYIEDKNHKVQHFPIASLAEADLAFVKKKQAQIEQINHLRNKHIENKKESLTIGDFKLLFLAVLLLALGVYFYKNFERNKMKYIIPTLSLGLLFSLYGFTNKVMQSLSTTDPNFVDSAFAPFKPNVYTRWDANYFYVESKGIPSHPMMQGITGWQQQFPIPQCYTGSNAWSIPLNPVKASTPVPVNQNHFLRGAVAIAANGVAIFNPYTNTGVDALLDGQLDTYGGHCGRADDYHYHIAPLFLDAQTSDIVPIAFALDGYAVYGSQEPDGSAMKTLDGNHGHAGTNGVYHYHGTATAPYMIGNMVGKVTEDSTLQIIPQASAKPVRPSGTPLKGAVITSCKPNKSGNGYTLIYTLAGATDSVEYSWNTNGVYTFNYYKSGVKTTNNYNGFKQCNLPVSIVEAQREILSIGIFPNPSKTQIDLQLSGSLSAKDIQELNIYNSKGELVYRSNAYKGPIDIKNFADGYYTVSIKAQNLMVTKKFIVQ